MTIKKQIQRMYEEDFQRLVVKMSYRAGGIANGEDVVQEAFTRALQYRRGYNPHLRELGAWFNTILNNTLRDFKREEKMEGMTLEDLSEPLEDVIIREEMVELVQSDIEAKTPEEQEVLYLFYVLGFTVKEIKAVTRYRQDAIHVLTRAFRREERRKYGEGVFIGP